MTKAQVQGEVQNSLVSETWTHGKGLFYKSQVSKLQARINEEGKEGMLQQGEQSKDQLMQK